TPRGRVCQTGSPPGSRATPSAIPTGPAGPRLWRPGGDVKVRPSLDMRGRASAGAITPEPPVRAGGGAMGSTSSRVGLALLALVSAGGVARAQGPDLRYETAEQLYALSEVLDGGAPLWAELFAQGWPTDARHRRLTLEL